MKPSTLAVAGFACLSLAVAGATVALAQYRDPAGETIEAQTIDVPFAFQAGTKTLPAGSYTIEQASRELLIFRSAKGIACEVPVITRIAKPVTPLADGRVVFDKFGDNFYISELWVPGADGFYLGGMREPHTHQAVKASRKK